MSPSRKSGVTDAPEGVAPGLALLGAGAWGTALALAFACQYQVRLWTPEAAHAEQINRTHENQRYLPGFPLPHRITATADIQYALADARLALIATPLAGLADCVTHIARFAPDLSFIWACKGLETKRHRLPHEIVQSLIPHAHYAMLSGPSFAEEVARGLPAAVVLAAQSLDFAVQLAQRLYTPQLRIYASDDLIGVEVGAAVKNVLAIAVGICDGLGLGYNARAALMTRGLAEITRFGVALGARQETFLGLSGAGDLMLTCTGDLSRNRRVGLALAQGRLLADITAGLGHVAEGVPTAHAVLAQAQALGISMPITEAVCAVLNARLTPAAAVDALLARDLRQREH